jgi:hypothetical protein
VSNIWLLGGSFSTHLRFAPSTPDGAEPLTVTFFTAPGGERAFAMSLYTGHIGERPSPAAEMILTLEDFDTDFFTWGGSMFVSEHMRQAMALDEAVARFYEIDASRSAALVRSKNYMLMQPLLEDDVSDPEGSIYRMERLTPHLPPLPTYVRSIAVRPGFEPDCDLFADSFFSTEIFCTDELASRVLKAGCTGATFTHPTGFGDGNTRRRTLRGIEKVVDWVKGEEVTELVEAID